MKVMIPVSGPGLQFPVDPRFGRAPYYAVVDTENPDNAEVFPNPYAFYPSAAGIAAAQLAIQRGVQAVVAPAVGPNASMVLMSAGIRIIPSFGGIARDLVVQLKEGKIPQTAPAGWMPSEKEFLEGQISALENQLKHLKQWLEELKKQKEVT